MEFKFKWIYIRPIDIAKDHKYNDIMEILTEEDNKNQQLLQ